MAARGSGYLARPAPSGLADVVEIILDKGIVIDAYVRVSLVGIEVLTIDARLVVASVDTYLRFAEATNRLDLGDQGGMNPLDAVTEGVGEVTEKVASKVVESKVDDVVEPPRKAVRGAKRTAAKVAEKADDLVEKVRPDR
jgi:hypothetical protein